MIYLRLFLNFLMISALSFGGGYGMVSLVRETVLSNGWLTENEFLNFIAVSESTQGPLAVIFDYSLNCIRTKEFDEICTRQRLFIGSSSVRCSDDPVFSRPRNLVLVHILAWRLILFPTSIAIPAEPRIFHCV